jgi:hypothetical protein
MKKIKFKDTEPKISLLDIENLEKYVNLTFPDSYKKHLIRYNGGYCVPDTFDFIENGQNSNSCIDYFLAIYDGLYCNLKNRIDMLKINNKRLPQPIIPFADDPFGNAICFSCGEKDYGYIYFWNHEREVDYSVEDDSNYDNLYLIANSFTEFLEGLYEETDE